MWYLNYGKKGEETTIGEVIFAILLIPFLFWLVYVIYS